MAKRGKRKYAIGVDYGTNSVRALFVDTADGDEVASCVYDYPSGEAGILLDPKDPNLARQNPADYIEGFYRLSVRGSPARPRAAPVFGPEHVVGIGVDTTGSTPIPGRSSRARRWPCSPSFASDLAAQAWLWKDHTGHAEAAEITEKARRGARRLPGQVRRHLQQRVVLVEDPALQADRRRRSSTPPIPGSSWPISCRPLSRAISIPTRLPRGICAAGHKAMYNDEWGGLPARSSWRNSIPPWPSFADRYAARP